MSAFDQNTNQHTSVDNENVNTNMEVNEPIGVTNNANVEHLQSNQPHSVDAVEPSTMDDNGARYEVGEGNPLRVSNANYPEDDMKYSEHHAVPHDDNDNNDKKKEGSSASSLVSSTGKVVQTMWIVEQYRKIMPDGGFLSGVFNLAGGSIGGGILGIPNGFNVSGIVMGTIYLIVIFLLTVFSMRIMGIAAKKTGIKTYEKMAGQLFGRGGDIFTAVIMFVKCYGACISYVISIGDLWSAFLKDDRVTGYYRTVSFRRVLTVITFFVFMWPLSLPKKINSLRYVSLFAVLFIVYFVICDVIHSATNGLKDGIADKHLKMFTSGNSAISGLGIFMFSYLCQSNMFEVWREIKPEPSVFRIEWESFVGMFLCTILYWMTGFFSYADFGTGISGSLLTFYYPLRDYYFIPAYLGVAVKLCVAFSLHILPARDSCHHLLKWELDTVAWWKNAVLVSILCGISLLLGLFIKDVNTVFSLLGSFAGAFIAFVFPALFFMYAGNFDLKHVHWFDYWMTYILLIAGVCAICFGTPATIYGMI